MKKLTLSIVIFVTLISNLAFAGSCEVSKFLSEGMSAEFSMSMSELHVKILEIDKKTCWIKTEIKKGFGVGEVVWVNLNTVESIRDLEGGK